LNCPNMTYFDAVNYVCAPVSSSCATYNSLNGSCTSCVDQTNIVVNGLCISNLDNCAVNQYILSGVCLNVTPNCVNFVKIGGTCISCAQGYSLATSNNTCNAIICPNRYYADPFGNCIKVSDLCTTYTKDGSCASCPSGYVINGASCLQVYQPATCFEALQMGISTSCTDSLQFCATLTTRGDCSVCNAGYTLNNVTGGCDKAVTCGPRQYQINGYCYDVSPTCGNWDPATGKCLNCADPTYNIYMGLCIKVSSCGVR
jgi:hypothetical protein